MNILANAINALEEYNRHRDYKESECAVQIHQGILSLIWVARLNAFIHHFCLQYLLHSYFFVYK